MNIRYPWIIQHQPGGKGYPLETILAGSPDAKPEHFGLAVADLVRHIARHFEADEADILAIIQREIDEPTTTIIRTGPN